MKVAITYEAGQIFQHFGKTQMFKMYEIDGGKILSSQLIDTLGQGHGALAGLLRAAGAEVLICGGIGAGAREALSQAGIEIYPGVSGSADTAAQTFAEGRLEKLEGAACDHHHDTVSGHTCGEGRSCGGH